MNHNPKPNAGLPGLVQPQSPTIADSVGAKRATPRNDPPIGNGTLASQPAMTNRTLGANTQDETRAEDGASSGQSLRQALDRLATQLDDTTHHGMGLVVRLMIESRERDARERQSDGYPRTEEMKRLRLPLEGPEAQHAYLRFIHAAASPGTSSGWLAMLEKNLFADIVLVEELAGKGEGGYLAIASAGKLTIADLVSHLVHLRKRLTFWAGTLETYPPPLVDDVVGLVADAAKQLRYAANLPANVPAHHQQAPEISEFTSVLRQVKSLLDSPPSRTPKLLAMPDGLPQSPYGLRLARTRSAYLECHGDVNKVARRLYPENSRVSKGQKLRGISTIHDHLRALDELLPNWRHGAPHSDVAGNPEQLKILRRHRKSEERSG